jgi:hypothetical protein
MSLIFVSGTKSGYYHNLLNEENVEHWMFTQLLPNLEEPSVIVMDSVPYHSVLLEEPPTHSWRKNEITARLQEEEIPFAKGTFQS